MFLSIDGVELLVEEGDVLDVLRISSYGPPGARLPWAAANGDETATFPRDVILHVDNGGCDAALGVWR
jgi:hypothetical protein